MHFKPKILSGWGNLPKSPTKISSFQSVNELKDILQHQKIIARGLGRSYADQATNKGNYAVDFSSFDRFISFDDDRGILECESGVSLEKIIRFLGPRGWFPMVCPGTKYITVGGAIANDVHGKAHHIDGSFVNCVEELTLLLPNSKIVKADREHNEDLFWANFGGLGLLGYILSARLRLKRIDSSYFEQLSVPVRDLEEMLDLLDARDRDFIYSVALIDSLATGKKTGRGVVTFGNHARIDELPFAKMIEPIRISGKTKYNVPFFMPPFVLNSLSANVVNKVLYLRQKRGTGISHYDSFFFPKDLIKNWNRGYGKKGFIQYQFVVPAMGGRENIRRILATVSESGCTPFLTVLKKFGKGRSGQLSFPMEGYSLAMDFPVTAHLKGFIKTLDTSIADAGGRVYLGKDAFLEEENFKKMYPEWEGWMKVKKEYDPENFFSSDLSRRIGLC